MAKESGELQRREEPPVRAVPERPSASPAADVIETPAAFTVVADLPGVDEASLDVKVERNVLTVSARASEEPPQGHVLARAEYAPADYRRTFLLSDEIDREGIAAELKNGVLRLTLPKAERARARRIAVKAE